MLKIALPKGTGKTDNLIVLSANNWFYIVCRNPDLVARRARQLGLDIPQPLSYFEFCNNQYFGKGIKGFLVDDADALIQSMTIVKVHAVTMRIGEED